MKPALIVHGGAGEWPDDQDQPKAEAILRALECGWDILNRGGSASEAVEKAINILEDEPLFDAGIGSHLNEEGVVEMDAIFVDADTHDFGAVAGVQRVRYPISLARKVLEETDQKFFVGVGADKMAQKLGIPLVNNLDMVSEAELASFRKREKASPTGTVGAVAIDQDGKMVVGTSTGGTPNKPAGRVGDTPIFGAGAYAEKGHGGASATGVGENCMRTLLTKYIVEQIAGGKDAQSAVEASMSYINGFFDDSQVGAIVLDRDGKAGGAHTTDKLACGWVDDTGTLRVTMRGGVRG